MNLFLKPLALAVGLFFVTGCTRCDSTPTTSDTINNPDGEVLEMTATPDADMMGDPGMDTPLTPAPDTIP